MFASPGTTLLKSRRSCHHIIMLNYWKGNYRQINKDTRVINWQELLSEKSTEDAWNCFKQLVRNSMEKNVPTRKINGHTARKNPWITKSAKRNIAKRDKAWRQYRLEPFPLKLDTWNTSGYETRPTNKSRQIRPTTRRRY